VRGLEDLDLRHDAVGEGRGRGEVRQRLQLRGHRARLFQLRPTLGAAPDVRLERRHAEPYLPVEEQVDLVWK
jgi:hypothetical protein